MPQTQIYYRNAQIHMKAEGTVDTYDDPDGDGTGMFMAENVVISYESQDYTPQYIRGDGLAMDEIQGPVSSTITFDVPMKGGGALGTAPEYGTALMACGMREEVDPSTHVKYIPYTVFDGATTGTDPALNNPAQSYSLSVLENGNRHAISGCFGSFVLNAPVTDIGKLSFTMQGAYQPFALDALESPTYQTTNAPGFTGASFGINFGGAVTPKGVETFTLDLGNTVRMGPDVNQTYGFYGARVIPGLRRSTGTFDPEDVAQDTANSDFRAIALAKTAGTITTGLIGGTEGNRWQVDIARATLRMPENVDADGVRKLNITYAVSSLATAVEYTNPDITITYT